MQENSLLLARILKVAALSYTELSLGFLRFLCRFRRRHAKYMRGVIALSETPTLLA